MLDERGSSTHARTLALVALYRSGDHVGVAELLSELSGPEHAAATIVSLIQFVSRLLDEAPEDGDVWLQDALVHLAQVEGESANSSAVGGDGLVMSISAPSGEPPVGGWCLHWTSCVHLAPREPYRPVASPTT